MSKICIIANQVLSISYDADAKYIGVDKGALFCMEQQIPLQFAIGDFDSISEQQLKQLQDYTEVVILPCEKDEVDTECALYLAARYSNDIDVYGVTGARLDHFMIMLQLLKRAKPMFRIIDEQNIIFLQRKGVHQIKKEGQYLSFFPLGPQSLSITGCKYALCEQIVDEQSVYLSSNEIVGEYATITHSADLLVIQSRDKI